MENNMNEKPLATDEECTIRRNELIAAGVIQPASKSDLIERKDGSIILSTRKNNYGKRKDLISKGVIDANLCELIPETGKHQVKEEGEYVSKPITSELEYFRRKQVYFRMMQEILKSRKELKLILGKKNDNDPDWYF